ncbi:hypothetical protein ACQE3E_03945 [Methylomonas sp. MED-D]|uniref:hypothetical protein n=1 Tax=unclassified Methylomonas TaxID=2608980 RepID=UPI0028A571B4|nr:hypothetical protein [Methylomonas sp. MV1]MDT4329940.1 hypothetical protein [Methylomonas sp. MV1]
MQLQEECWPPQKNLTSPSTGRQNAAHFGSLRCTPAPVTSNVMPLDTFTPGWKPVHVGVEGDGVSILGLKLWKFKWQSVGQEPIVVPHPSYLHERHQAWVYEVETSSKVVRFAAGELSNGVWGFYVPT